MREVVCCFTDEADMLSHFESTTSLTRVTSAELRIFEPVSLRLKVEGVSRPCAVRAHVTRKRAFMIDDGLDARVWRYTFVVVDEDLVWLDMFKHQMKSVVAFQAFAA